MAQTRILCRTSNLQKEPAPWGQALVISLSFPVILGHSVLEDFAVMMN